MKHWLAHHARTCGATLARLIRTPLATLLNASVIGVALALPVGFHLALVTTAGVASVRGDSPLRLDKLSDYSQIINVDTGILTEWFRHDSDSA